MKSDTLGWIIILNLLVCLMMIAAYRQGVQDGQKPASCEAGNCCGCEPGYPVDSEGVMPEYIDELEVKKHIRMKSKLGSIDVHCSETAVGAWLGHEGQTLGICVSAGSPCLVIYSKGKAMPDVALSVNGLQLLDADGKPVVIQWSDVLKKLQS